MRKCRVAEIKKRFFLAFFPVVAIVQIYPLNKFRLQRYCNLLKIKKIDVKLTSIFFYDK